MFDLRHAALAYWRARRITTAQQLETVHDRRLQHWLQHDVPHVRRYAGFAGTLSDLPIVDKATLMADFAAFNTAGITAEMGWAAFAGDRMVGEHVVGASTGTSGNRGLFVISQAERFCWLGTILAKALPGFWRESHRVAILLPLNTPLYDSANRLRRLSLKFFDLSGDWATGLQVFDPTVIIAPPKILRSLAEQKMPLTPRKIYAGAEQLDPLDRAVIEAHFGLTLGQIYMATEGLFAVSCARGTLHLCQDTMHFELPPVGDGDLHEVIISDFSREVQIMARYRMNDLIRLAPDCPCGSPLQPVAEVVGRMDDCFVLGPDKLMLTPDVIRNAVVDSDRRITDFRVVQTGDSTISLQVPVGMEAASAALQKLFQNKGLNITIQHDQTPITLRTDRKLRRVENRHAR
ncbi:CoF synthetase [Yoonia sp. SDW83-1]|uniref:CoF synthetase n=1 Tax=Yoonia sp. SDW83-1 TaxID=3366945 RepID=UPI00398C522D